MATLKCKYCGNALHPQEGQTMITCGRCDRQTVIFTADEKKKQRLLEDAADLRMRCLFDRAKSKYENVIQEYPKEGEAYWGYVLCNYGVEFQLDSRTGKYLPTLHRISQRSVLQDPYYQKALENANPLEAEEYTVVALELDRIRKRFLELSQKEENRYDIFISFKQTDDETRHETVDCSKAENIYHKLKEMGYRVFFSKITLADRGGDDYEPIIYTALEASKVMLVIGSRKEYLEAPWVRNEWSRFLDMMQENSNKKLLPVLINEMDPSELPDALQSIQGYNADTTLGMDRLLSRVTQLAPKKVKQESAGVGIKEVSANEKSLLKRAAIESESGNWDKAREYYNKILDVYPESAQAWTGLWLASDLTRMKTLEQLEDTYTSLIDEATKNSECMVTLNIHKDIDTVDEDGLSGIVQEYDHEDVQADFYNDLKQYVVPNYYEINDMRKNLPSEMPQYSSSRLYLKGLSSRIDRIFEDENFRRALHFADKEYANELIRINVKLKGTCGIKFRDILAQEEREEKRLRAALIENYEAGVCEIKSEMEKAEQCRENEYELACEDMRSSSASQKAQYILNLLAKIGDYKDALQKKVAVKAVVAKQNEIGDGKRYLINTILNSDLNAVIDYKNAKQDTMFKERPSIRNIIFSLVYVFFMVAPFIILEWPTMIGIVAGYATCYFLWKRDLILPGYIVLVIIQAVSIAFWDISVAAIVGAMYAASYFIKGGLAKKIMSNMQNTINFKHAEKQIQNDERIIENELNEIWQRAFAIDYDGVHLSSALLNESMGYADTVLRANNIQTSGNNSRTVDVDKIVQDAMKGDWTHFNDIFK